jgi:hypothetical protein
MPDAIGIDLDENPATVAKGWGIWRSLEGQGVSVIRTDISGTSAGQQQDLTEGDCFLGGGGGSCSSPRFERHRLYDGRVAIGASRNGYQRYCGVS